MCKITQIKSLHIFNPIYTAVTITINQALNLWYIIFISLLFISMLLRCLLFAAQHHSKYIFEKIVIYIHAYIIPFIAFHDTYICLTLHKPKQQNCWLLFSGSICSSNVNVVCILIVFNFIWIYLYLLQCKYCLLWLTRLFWWDFIYITSTLIYCL